MKTSSKSFKILIALAVLSVAAMVLTLCLTGNKTAKFSPPPFEAAAIAGTPTVPAELGYGELWQEGMTYRFSVCGNVRMHGREAAVYFTNPSVNVAWLKLRVYSESGELLGETGLIKPGEYVENVTLSKEPAVGTKIVLKSMGYEPETYHSTGAVTLKTSIS